MWRQLFGRPSYSPCHPSPSNASVCFAPSPTSCQSSLQLHSAAIPSPSGLLRVSTTSRVWVVLVHFVYVPHSSSAVLLRSVACQFDLASSPRRHALAASCPSLKQRSW